LANNLPDIVIRFDRGGRYLYVSPVIEQLTGRPPAFYLGKTQAELKVANDLQALFDATLKSVLADGTQRRSEFEAAGVSGSRWFDAVLAPELDRRGEVDTVLLIARDITERKLAEAAVRESGLLARHTVDALSAQVAILDQHGRILDVNRAWREFAADNAAVASRVLEGVNYLAVCERADVVGHAEGRAVAEGIRKVLRGELAEFALEYPCHSPTEQRWFTARVTRFLAGDAPRIVIAHENITNRKLAEERMAHYRDHLEEQVALRTDELARANVALIGARDAADSANRAKSDFLAHMSHEIRTPMSAIIGLARMLRAEIAEPAPLGHLTMLQGAADHLLRIVNDVLDLSKIEAGQMELEEADFSLRQVLTHAADMLQHRASEKGLDLAVEIDPQLPAMLHGDALRLEQIVLNFLGNAIKFTQTGGIRLRALALGTEGATATLRLEVRDSGIGITPEQQQRLFQTFSQADDSIARRFGGSGLGLVIARRLAGLMGGEVGVNSEAGVGSTFWARVSLRRARGGPRAVAILASAPADKPLLGMRALLVEDDPVNQLVTAEALRTLGADVDLADNGADAVQRVHATRYSFVLMDLHMPVLDGIAATRLIRKYHDRDALPIIGMTATALEEDRGRCLEAGMNTHVGKPVDLAQLRATLGSYRLKS
ncbi:MAG TPA: ATP-binding protein, partial [Burkholderiaceae bacterium]